MNKLLIATLLTAGMASAVPSAIAQTATPAPQAQSEKGQEAKRPFRLPSERVEARLAYLRTALKITDAQKPQWETFAATMRKQAREADKRVQERRTQMAERSKRQKSAIERLERRQQMMTARAQRLNELLVASKPLYATFTSEQKQVADSLFSSGRGRGGHHGHRGSRGAA